MEDRYSGLEYIFQAYQGRLLMKYFTKELYEKMQLIGALVLPTEIDYIYEMKEFYKTMGRDYEAEQITIYGLIKPYLLKHLPEHLKVHVHNGDFIGNKVPSDHLRTEIERFRIQIDREWEEANGKYFEEYRKHREKLKDSVREIYEQIDFHDAKITAIEKSAEDEVKLYLDCSQCMSFRGLCTLTFSGVSNAEFPIQSSQYYCLYSELYAKENGCYELRVLLDTCTGYLSLDTLIVEANNLKMVIIKND